MVEKSRPPYTDLTDLESRGDVRSRPATGRFVDMAHERTDALEADKKDLTREIKLLLERIQRLEPENARLREALEHAKTNSTLSLILVTLGGGIVGYASFTGSMAQGFANVGAGILISGVLMMAVVKARDWTGRS